MLPFLHTAELHLDSSVNGVVKPNYSESAVSCLFSTDRLS